MIRRHVALGLLAIAAACGDEQPAIPQGPELPPLELQPFLPKLEQLIAAMPRPDEATQRELNEYAEIALGIVEADSRVKPRAERALLEHPDAWFVLEPALAHEDATVRRRAAWLAGRTGLGVLQLPLLHRLKYESDPEAVVWVGDALQRLGNDTGLAWLDAAMGAEATAKATADLAGQRAIEICSARGIELGESPTYAELRAVMQRLGKAWDRTGVGGAPDVVPPSGPQLDARLATRLATTESTLLRPIDDAKFVLTRSGVIPLPLIASALSAEEHYLRSVALEILARIGPPAKPTGPAVIGLLTDPMTAVYAVRTLGDIGETAALPYLRPMIESIDTDLRSEAARALGLLGDESSRAALAAHLLDEAETMDVRVSAAFGLLCLGEHDKAQAFLDEREQKGDYHEATLTLLRERLQARKSS